MTKTALFALLAMWGVGAIAPLPAIAEDTPGQEVDATDDATDDVEPGLTDRVWIRADSGDDLPGPMQVFLSDGTLVTDSCWETYRLSEWKMSGEHTVTWNEDGMDISADIVSITSSELVLSLKLGSEAQEQRFVAADVPYVCPDIPK